MAKLNNLKILIIEDESASAFLLRQYLFDLKFEDVNIYADAQSGMEALRIIKPDILFLDIYLKGNFSGIDVLKFIDATKMHTHVIITSGNDKYVKDVVRFSVIDFLLKPISREDLRLAVEKVEQHVNMHHKPNTFIDTSHENQLIEINSNKEISYYNPKNIVFIEADGNYSQIYLVNGKKEMVTQNLGKLSEKFPADFIRVSRKSIVNKNFLKKLNKQTGELELEFNGTSFKINTSKKYFLTK